MKRRGRAKRTKAGSAAPGAATDGLDRYDLYRRAVQSPDVDVEFLRDTYAELKKTKAQSLREDFCGTFAISCEWAKLSKSHRAFAIDIDPEPLAYGRTNSLSQLPAEVQTRVEVQQANVLSSSLPKADIVAAMNFSYYVFKSRQTMLTYFKNARATVASGGLFIIDCFGGPACETTNVEETKHRGFTYLWEQASFDPVSNEAVFYIHFKVKQKSGRWKRIERAFTYDWRMWSIPELREIMLEAGFKKTHVYWEGTTRGGEGDGIFSRVEKGEECEAWVAYIVGES